MAAMTTSQPTESRARRGPDSIVKNAVSTFAAQMTTASLTAVLTLFLVRGLGARQYGLFALTIGMSSIAIALADLGITDSTARFVAEHRGRDEAELGALISDALKLKVVATGVLCAVFAGMAPVIAHAYGNAALAWPVRGIALATFGQSTYQMVLAVSTALGRSAVNVRLVAAESVIEVCASVGLVVAGAGAAGAAFGRAVGFTLGALIAAAVVLRLNGRVPGGLLRRPRRDTIRLVSGYAGPVFAIDASYTLSSSLGVLLVGAYSGSAASGVFQAPSKLIVLIQYVGLSTAYGVAPRLTRGPGQEPNVGAMNRALRGLIGFQCLMLAPAVVWAHPITRLLLGSGYAGSARVLAALAPYIFFSGLAPLVTTGVSYLGEARRRVPVAVATLVLVAVSGVILIPRDGIVGAAIATDIAFGFYTLAHIWLCRRLLDLRVRMLAWSLACGLTAAAAMGVVLTAVGTRHLTILDWVVGLAGGTGAYGAMLVFSGEIRGGDLARAAAAVRRGRRGSPPDPAPAPATWPPSRVRVPEERRSPASQPPPWLAQGGASHPGVGPESGGRAGGRPRPPTGAKAGPRTGAKAGPRTGAKAGPRPGAKAGGRGKAASRADADLVYQIGWRLVDGDSGVFQLSPAGMAQAEGADSLVGEPSRPVSWGGLTPPTPTPEARRAHADLVSRLLDADWRRAGSGDVWFAHCFRAPTDRRRDGSRSSGPADRKRNGDRR